MPSVTNTVRMEKKTLPIFVLLFCAFCHFVGGAGGPTTSFRRPHASLGRGCPPPRRRRGDAPWLAVFTPFERQAAFSSVAGRHRHDSVRRVRERRHAGALRTSGPAPAGVVPRGDGNGA